MMEKADIPFLSVSQLSELIKSRQVSPVEVVAGYLERIDRLNDRLYAYLTVCRDQAVEAARASERELARGAYRGPLRGVPVAVKDQLNTAGIRTTCGTPIFNDVVPDEDATVIAKLKAAGAILLGKLNMTEFGTTSLSHAFDTARNRWAVERVIGGSSSGSGAATAAFLCATSLGEDTGGSVRGPAAWCGVVGLRPTWGRVSRHGVFPLGFSLDHIGPFATTVEDAAFVYQTISGADSRDDSIVDRPVDAAVLTQHPRLTSKKVGVPRNFYFEKLHPDVEAATRKALTVFESLGASLVDIEVPDMEEYSAIARLILLAEASSVHARRLEERRQDFGDDVRSLLDQGRFILATDYLNAQRQRRHLAEKFRDLLSRVDVVATPAVSVPAPKIGQKTLQVGGEEQEVRIAVTRIPRALNLTGLPLLTLPCGFSSEGLPIGLQLIGSAFDEKQLLEIGHAYEQSTEWHKRRPPVAA